MRAEKVSRDIKAVLVECEISHITRKSSFPGGSVVKNLPAMLRPGFCPWVGKISWRRKGQPTPVFLPGESHGQRSLVGYIPVITKSRTRLSD